MKLTKAQEETLVWLASDMDEKTLRDPLEVWRSRNRWTGGSLVDLYEDRWREARRREAEEDGREWDPWSPGTDRRHGWRRTGGRVLRGLAQAGAVMDVGFEGAARGTSYCLTTEGAREVLRLRAERAS